MNSLPCGRLPCGRAHCHCLKQMKVMLHDILIRLVTYYTRRYALTSTNGLSSSSWELVKGILHDAMKSTEAKLREQGFKSRNPPGLPCLRSRVLVSAEGFTFYDEEGNGVVTQRHIPLRQIQQILEDDIGVCHTNFTTKHDMTREMGWALVKSLLRDVEEAITYRCMIHSSFTQLISPATHTWRGEYQV